MRGILRSQGMFACPGPIPHMCGGGAMAYLLIPLTSADDNPPVIELEPLAAWVAVATASADPCLILDDRGRVAGCSKPAAELLGEGPDQMCGRTLVGDVIDVVDFSA